jgi:hypothetical protein
VILNKRWGNSLNAHTKEGRIGDFLALPARGIISPHDVISTKISRIAKGITELIRGFIW